MRRSARTAKVLGAVLILALASGCERWEREPDDPTAFRVLACNPSTGTLGYLGSSLKRSMSLAEDEINAGGGVLGRRFELVEVDSHSDPDAGLAEAQFFYERYRESIVGIAGETLDTVSKKLLKEIANNDLKYGQKIPMISPASSSPEFSELVDASGIFFRTVSSSHHQGSILARKAQAMGFKRGLILSIDDLASRRLAETFARTFASFGDEFVTRTGFYSQATEAGIAAALSSASTVEPEFLLVIAYGNDGKIALRQWADHSANLPLFLSSTLMSDDFVASLDQRTTDALNAQAVNGVIASADPNGPGYQRFVREYCSRYGDDCRCPTGLDDCDKTTSGRVPSFVPDAYDAVYLLALAIQKTGLPHPAAVERSSSWDVQAITENILDVTSGTGGIEVGIEGWAHTLSALGGTGGPRVQYLGASASPLRLDSNGDPQGGYFVAWTIKDGAIAQTNSDGEEQSFDVEL